MIPRDEMAAWLRLRHRAEDRAMGKLIGHRGTCGRASSLVFCESDCIVWLEALEIEARLGREKARAA